MTKFPLIVVFLTSINVVALCSSKSVLSQDRGQMDISYIDVTAVFGSLIVPLSILSTDSGVWKAVMYSTLKEVTFQEYRDYGSKSSREDMVGRCTIMISK